jgi:acyl-CoA synthetase (AMP-forming)/AMP-acid ligase II
VGLGVFHAGGTCLTDSDDLLLESSGAPVSEWDEIEVLGVLQDGGHCQKAGTLGIASFKLPERLERMESFPISPAGKILKRELREIVARRLALEQTSR